MDPTDLTIELLKGIRDEIHGTNQRVDGLNQRMDGLSARVDRLGLRLDGAGDRLARRIEESGARTIARIQAIDGTLQAVLAQRRDEA